MVYFISTTLNSPLGVASSLVQTQADPTSPLSLIPCRDVETGWFLSIAFPSSCYSFMSKALMRCLFKASQLLRKQTQFPPKHVAPLKDNPLTRWSERLPSQWSLLPAKGIKQLNQLEVGLEGCESAFNATNAIRTCWSFQTMTAPRFLSLKGPEEIEHLQHREDPDSSSSSLNEMESDSDNQYKTNGRTVGVALFGEETFFCSASQTKPLIALENFSALSRSIFRCRIQPDSKIVVGHENQGVRDALVKAPSGDSKVAEHSVVYIPQYGTISSLNVITSLGIALFYAFLDKFYPSSRSIETGTVEGTEFAQLTQFQRQFEQPLPSSPTQPRLDARPVHPMYYGKEAPEIQSLLATYRQQLLNFSSRNGSQMGQRFGISLLYENDFDQRNFGGLIRNANAFLVDRVCYLGRKKFNVVGAVGSYHYTAPYYLGPGFEKDEETAGDEEDELMKTVHDTLNGMKDVDEHRQRIVKLALWSLKLRNQVAGVCGGNSKWWLLDCGHQSLYAEDFASQQEELKAIKDKGGKPEELTHKPFKSSLESLRWYLTHYSDDSFHVCLCNDEASIREAAEGGVVLVVPQEGKLPHISVLMQCERIVTICPSSADSEAEGSLTGLPSQVASGIALQRLSSVFHPATRKL